MENPYKVNNFSSEKMIQLKKIHNDLVKNHNEQLKSYKELEHKQYLHSFKNSANLNIDKNFRRRNDMDSSKFLI
jgi:hypothetical protein